ncbi:MAG TPA: hypothetical protein DDW49_01100 [Deltaproteobacteria bacterium]|nr:MAG: hypothetical protein A2048_08455 [Deltaproteobacteria bacterium GWA2_45_12]HBF11979.1 hypothetical protein [Deltaproteobacteria bacterium]
MQNKFEAIFTGLNNFIQERNQEAPELGVPLLPKQSIKIIGQMVLVLADLPFPVERTLGLDVISPLNPFVQKQVSDLLIKEGMHLEADGHLVWMPINTSYKKIFDSLLVEVLVADVESVLASKYKFKRPKDQKLIQTFFNYFPEKVALIKKKVEWN